MSKEEALLANAAKQIEIKIKGQLIQKGLTQKELAKQLEVKPSTLNAAIHGNTDPRSVELRSTIYKMLGI